jgi:hypothetical protein
MNRQSGTICPPDGRVRCPLSMPTWNAPRPPRAVRADTQRATRPPPRRARDHRHPGRATPVRMDLRFHHAFPWSASARHRRNAACTRPGGHKLTHLRSTCCMRKSANSRAEARASAPFSSPTSPTTTGPRCPRSPWTSGRGSHRHPLLGLSHRPHVIGQPRGPKTRQGGCSPRAPGNPVNIPHDIENRGVATGNDQKQNPQVSGRIRRSPQVTESARLNLSGWRHGSNPVRDVYQASRRAARWDDSAYGPGSSLAQRRRRCSA